MYKYRLVNTKHNPSYGPCYSANEISKEDLLICTHDNMPIKNNTTFVGVSLYIHIVKTLEETMFENTPTQYIDKLRTSTIGKEWLKIMEVNWNQEYYMSK